MIQKPHHHTQIYRKIFFVIAALGVLMPLFLEVKYSAAIGETSSRQAGIQKSADEYFSKAVSISEEQEQLKVLQKAIERYYMLSQLNPEDIHSIIQIGRIYTMCKKDKLAKDYFYRAISLDSTNPEAHYYFGNLYYSEKKYTKALEYYKKAYNLGMTKNSDLVMKMAAIYERYGDLLRANQYYKKAFLLNPEDSEIADKIRDIESLKYKNSGYYSRNRNK